MSIWKKSKTWAKKYRLLDVFFWILITYLSLITHFDPQAPFWATVSQNIMLVAIGFVPFYFTAYYLVPNYLYKLQYKKFIIIIVLMAICMTLIYISYIYIYLYLFERDLFYKRLSGTSFNNLSRQFYIIFWTYIIPLISASAVKIMSDRMRSEKKLLIFKQEKLNTELNFLRSQINPHFLFNVMNTIYFQISKENTRARSLVEVISDMLRYQLYDCNAALVPMEGEINYLNNFIYINKFRKNFKGIIHVNCEENISYKKIAPLLIQPMLENAIRYMDSSASEVTMYVYLRNYGENEIQIHLTNSDETIVLDIDTYVTEDDSLDNFKRRLEIIYPGKHQFAYFKDKNQYYSKLTLDHG